ncbi:MULTISPECIES: SGNH/GDSL hydrolase family protein [Streptomyces]|uniref:SGNH/GDSL hydrolase family protein n=1 Tax=Streptomyces TaxID=1883 RepID=UPI00017EA0A5|nr:MULTISPECIES: SGNH/GDSL hydrolase family protein [Streptomyces]AKL66022.1 lipoprotein [Streptomyces sp. Mg1]EDX22729.1 lipoprotein [Streptomyces sp. Mg1]RPK52589.1 GDSL-like Lipase/Acylhydrolase [Streptomyces sp. ADI91-18]WSR98837.1 SGNH/GDSL hydrolase family protein [Streptomyces goshikiensis]WSY00131.1 SGNH/GDSL hydrolase family protein [Streptomyces goshikiensis]
MRTTTPYRRARRSLVGAVAAAAVLAGTVTGCSSGESSSGGERGAQAAPRWNTAPTSIAAVGDSITRGFDACSVLADCPEVSWATGDDPEVDSLATRLLGAAEAPSHSWNYAVTGSRMADLPAQLASAAEHKPDLVTVMVGSNDACRPLASSMTPVADFRGGFEQALAGLRAASPRSQVYVSSVPDLQRLWEQGKDSPMVRQIWKLGICQSMLADPLSAIAGSAARREQVRARVVEYNEVLREVCAKDELCRYDGGAVFQYPFAADQLSRWDWFHPGKDGQARLAELAHRQVTSVRPPR